MTDRINKTVLIAGVIGQGGAYVAGLPPDKSYTVHSIKHPGSSFSTGRIEDIYEDPHVEDARVHLHYGGMTGSTKFIRIVRQTQPTEIYKLAAQRHVAASFEALEYAAIPTTAFRTSPKAVVLCNEGGMACHVLRTCRPS